MDLICAVTLVGHREVARPRSAGHNEVFAALDDVDSIRLSGGQVISATAPGEHDQE